MDIDADSLSVVASFVGIIDLISLTCAHSSFNFNINKIFRQKLILHIMRVCNVNVGYARSLLTRINEHDAAISGSSILQIILGEFWEGSDLDIYIRKQKYEAKTADDIAQVAINSQHQPQPYQPYRHQIFSLNFIRPRFSAACVCTLLYNYKVKKYAKIRSPYNNIQIISMDNSHRYMFDAVTYYFDSRVVMNTFYKNKLEILDLPNIIKRNFVPNLYVFDIRRSLKYTDRNFKIVPDNYSIHQYMDILKQLIAEFKSSRHSLDNSPRSSVRNNI